MSSNPSLFDIVRKPIQDLETEEIDQLWVVAVERLGLGDKNLIGRRRKKKEREERNWMNGKLIIHKELKTEILNSNLLLKLTKSLVRFGELLNSNLLLL